VDIQGHILPLDPWEAEMDLPILNLDPSNTWYLAAPGNVQLLAETDRFRQEHPHFASIVSEVLPMSGGMLAANLTLPNAQLILPIGVSRARIDYAIKALQNDLAAEPGPRIVDLRYEDQVVIRIPVEPNQDSGDATDRQLHSSEPAGSTSDLNHSAPKSETPYQLHDISQSQDEES